MCGSCGKKSRPIPNGRTIFSPKPASATGCARRIDRRQSTMKIADFLAPANVKIDVASTDKKKLLAELAREAAAKTGIGADRIAAEVLKREELGSTGVGGGVAIPHARFPQSSKPFGMLARLRKP